MEKEEALGGITFEAVETGLTAEEFLLGIAQAAISSPETFTAGTLEELFTQFGFQPIWASAEVLVASEAAEDLSEENGEVEEDPDPEDEEAGEEGDEDEEIDDTQA